MSSPRRIVTRLTVFASLAVVVAGCSAPIALRESAPEPPAGLPSSPGTLGGTLDAIREVADRVTPGDSDAQHHYNYLVARLLEGLEHSEANAWSLQRPIVDSETINLFRIKLPPGLDTAGESVIPSDRLEFSGDLVGRQGSPSGLGAPCITTVDSRQRIGRMVPDKLPCRNLTAIVRFTGSEAILELLDPYQSTTVTLNGRTFRLAADFGAAVMLALSSEQIDKLGVVRLLRPSRYDDTANLTFLQPYDPKRTPVLFVHGLGSTPATFAPMFLSLVADPELRKHYQFWTFSYPSGYPYPYSAMLLRRELDEVQRLHPGHQGIVIIGHSMGGIISRLMLTNAGDNLWRGLFGKPPAETRIAGPSRALLEECLVFRTRPDIDRAIFICAPHRGSETAANPIGRFGSRLVRLPSFLADAKNSAISVVTLDPAAMVLNRAPNSIDTLSPTNRLLREVNKLPIAESIPYHSIIGDEGKGDTPEPSDGIVPYWSSHLDGAVSEKIVPSDHSAQQHPAGIEEVRRILKFHLRPRR